MDTSKINMEDVEDDLQNSFAATFGWFLVLNKLTQNDITKHKEVLDMKLVGVMNQLSYIIQLEKEQERQMKQMQKTG